MNHFQLVTESKIKDIKKLQEAFKKKKELECTIAKMIKGFEDETGLAIDMIKYQRDITIPIIGSKYTDLTIVVSAEEN